MTNIMILTSSVEQSSSSDVGRREFLGPVTDIFWPQSRAWSTRVCSITNTWYLSSTQSVGYEAQSPVPDPISERPLHDRGGPVKLRIVWLYSLSVCSSSFIWFRYLDWEFTWSLSVYSSLERLVCFIFSFHREERCIYISTQCLTCYGTQCLPSLCCHSSDFPAQSVISHKPSQVLPQNQPIAILKLD